MKIINEQEAEITIKKLIINSQWKWWCFKRLVNMIDFFMTHVLYQSTDFSFQECKLQNLSFNVNSKDKIEKIAVEMIREEMSNNSDSTNKNLTTKK